MDTYDPACVPQPFGLNNTGVICHINALLQAIVSNSAVVRATFANRDYLSRSGTGKAFYDFVWTAVPAARPPGSGPFSEQAAVASQSARVLAALSADLRRRRPAFRYGPSQESASEGLVLLLDMMDDPGGAAEGEGNPISRLFYHRYEGVVYCRGCKARVSEKRDVAVQFNLFHYDAAKRRPQHPAEFSEIVCKHVSKLEDYRCDKCGKTDGGFRLYNLRMVPEVFVCLFNLYNDHKARTSRYFPVRITFPGIDGGQLVFRQTAQVEQAGNRRGGHYVARALRADGHVYLLNDHSDSLSAEGPSPNVYMVFYHVEQILAPRPAAEGGAKSGDPPGAAEEA